MIALYNGESHNFVLKCYRANSNVLEDFTDAEVFLFLVGADKTPLAYTIENNVIKFSLGANLNPEAYDIEVIWSKQTPIVRRHLNSKVYNFVKVQDAFALTEHRSEATGMTSDQVVQIISHAASYGYDGLNSYELAVVRGVTTLSEKNWVANLSEMNNRINGAVTEANTARDAANTAAGRVETAISNANTATAAANTATSNANTATSNANTATSAANTAKANADAATAKALATEKSVSDAEALRVSQENTRLANEGSLASQSGRVWAEKLRSDAETLRASAELARESQAGSDHSRAESDHSKYDEELRLLGLEAIESSESIGEALENSHLSVDAEDVTFTQKQSYKTGTIAEEIDAVDKKIIKSGIGGDIDWEDADLAIADGNGSVIAMLSGGDVKTKNFDSASTPSQSNDNSDANLNFGDEQGNVIAEFKDGHVRTKEFNSKRIVNSLYRKNQQVTVDVDTESGHRNVSSIDGSFKSTTTSNYYATEIELNGTETLIEFTPTTFTGNYGYAFMKKVGNTYTFISGKKTTKEDKSVNPLVAIKAGANIFRVSTKPGEITVYRKIEGDRLAQMEEDIRLAALSVPKFSHYNVIGSPVGYVSSYDVSGLATFNSLSALYSAFDELAAQYPDFLKREDDLGLDESGAYTMRYYTLRNQNSMITDDRSGTGDNLWDDNTYQPKRILLNMGIHSGTEKYSTLGSYLAVKEILESNDAWAWFIKSNYIIDIIPMMNPWGLANGRGTNVNNKNLNRDFVSKSQQETKNVIALINKLLPCGLCGIIDTHNTGSSTNGYLVSKYSYKRFNYYALLTQQLNALMLPLTDQIFGTERRNHFHLWTYESESSSVGQLHEYADKLGLLGCSIEASSTTINSSLMTKTCIINLVQALCTYEGE